MTRHIGRVREARKKLRRALVEAQGNLCAFCFELMEPDSCVSSDRKATLDHVFPLRGGGTDATCLAVHQVCNGMKGARPPTGCELLMLAVVRLRITKSPRLQAIVSNALQVLGNVPSWALFGRVEPCGCEECRTLDARHPKEGQQLMLPILRAH